MRNFQVICSQNFETIIRTIGHVNVHDMSILPGLKSAESNLSLWFVVNMIIIEAINYFGILILLKCMHIF